MFDAYLELDEPDFLYEDPPENEDTEEENSQGQNVESEDGDEDPLAPTGDGDIKPPGTIGDD
ncbi:MAG: hypothetical protein AAGD96_18430 [Chloroflexota bacterium]